MKYAIFPRGASASRNAPAAGPAEGDEMLLARCRAGDAHAWGELVDRYRRWVLWLAYRLSGNRDAAEDIAGETFLRAYTKLSTFSGSCKIQAWLRTIVHNVYIDGYVRRASSRELPLVAVHPEEPGSWEALEIEDPAPGPEQIACGAEVQRVVRDAVHRLPSNYRTVLEMYYLEDCSYLSIATSLKLPLGTVKSRVSRARESLRERLVTCDIW